jgi:hypothetical protein
MDSAALSSRPFLLGLKMLESQPLERERGKGELKPPFRPTARGSLNSRQNALGPGRVYILEDMSERQATATNGPEQEQNNSMNKITSQ